jgi:hypothetical protein
MKRLVGKTITEIIGCEVGSEEITFVCETGEKFCMIHRQDCCEDVRVEDICGDVNHLIGLPIIEAEECNNMEEPKIDDYVESYKWTFYRIATNRGCVVIRWLGQSNGCYSESVDFEQIVN